MANGYAGKIAFINLTTEKIDIETLDMDLANAYIGGGGLGARILFERQKRGVDPLGPDNILGFVTGPLTGTKSPTGARYMAVCKSPLTGGWGEANSGGFFGSELKAAGWDAIFFKGIAPAPKYLMIADDRIELRDASHLWGKDSVDTENVIQEQANDKRIRVACIGPASEKLSLISGIVNDTGRISARTGVGAVMGSKKLKAVAVRGTGKTPVADQDALDQVRKEYLASLKQLEGFYPRLSKFGTCGGIGALIASGASPVKNWQLSGNESVRDAEKSSDFNQIIKRQTRKYACANCPIACGGILDVKDGKYPVGETHKAEYETIGAFGAMCLCDDYDAIIKLNDLCNRSGLDTISAGSTLAFAMECFEKGVISLADTDGISLTWGNSEAMIAMLVKMVNREGFGDILADGVKVAAQKIGSGAEEFAVHIGGQEPAMHSPLLLPSRATGYVCDPTPGKHTLAAMARLDAGPGSVAPYPELKIDQFERYSYTGKGPLSARMSCYIHAYTSAGLCYFAAFAFGNYPFAEFYNAVTGQNLTMSEILTLGSRIQTMRQSFNLREGIKSTDFKLPRRMSGYPPQEQGPVAGKTIDVDSLAREYRSEMGWDAESGKPTDELLERLGMTKLIRQHS